MRSELDQEHTKPSEIIEDVDEHSHHVSDNVINNAEKRIGMCEEICHSDEETLTCNLNFDELNPGEVEENSLFDETLPIQHKTRLDFAELSPSPVHNSNSNIVNDYEVSFCPTNTTTFMTGTKIIAKKDCI